VLWSTFLRNHREGRSRAMDFFHGADGNIPRTLLLLLRHQPQPEEDSSIFNATEHPTSEWITQQMREAFLGGHCTWLPHPRSRR